MSTVYRMLTRGKVDHSFMNGFKDLSASPKAITMPFKLFKARAQVVDRINMSLSQHGLPKKIVECSHVVFLFLSIF